jgi:hypothetical protein
VIPAPNERHHVRQFGAKSGAEARQEYNDQSREQKLSAKWLRFHKHRGIDGLSLFAICNIVGYKIPSFVINNIVGLSFIFDLHFFVFRVPGVPFQLAEKIDQPSHLTKARVLPPQQHL